MTSGRSKAHGMNNHAQVNMVSDCPPRPTSLPPIRRYPTNAPEHDDCQSDSENSIAADLPHDLLTYVWDCIRALIAQPATQCAPARPISWRVLVSRSTKVPVSNRDS